MQAVTIVPTFHLLDLTVEVSLEHVIVRCGAHQNDLQGGIVDQQLLHDHEHQVVLHTALVHFVQNDVRVPRRLFDVLQVAVEYVPSCSIGDVRLLGALTPSSA